MKKTFFAILDSVTNSLKHYLSTVPNVNSSEMIKEFDKGSTKWYHYLEFPNMVAKFLCSKIYTFFPDVSASSI